MYSVLTGAARPVKPRGLRSDAGSVLLPSPRTKEIPARSMSSGAAGHTKEPPAENRSVNWKNYHTGLIIYDFLKKAMIEARHGQYGTKGLLHFKLLDVLTKNQVWAGILSLRQSDLHKRSSCYKPSPVSFFTKGPAYAQKRGTLPDAACLLNHTKMNGKPISCLRPSGRT